uniref:Putative bpti/kunitz family of serine protease inhibitor n=1 Tax=Amblyomma triste TaxID=251400 RepID=A0A023GCG9_AMBTT
MMNKSVLVLLLVATFGVVSSSMVGLMRSAVGSPDECTYPPETGPCKGRMPRFFYNINTSECEEFVYGGCHGNENNFRTYEDCENQCKTS